MITIKNDIKEKKKQRKKYLTPCAAVLLICSLAACAGGGAQKNVGGGAGAARTAETEAGTEENVSKQEAASLTGEETANSAESAKEEKQTPVTESRAQDWSALPNPIVDVGSSEDFEAAGLRLWLPANKEWYSDPDYSMIGDKAAQIQFTMRLLNQMPSRGQPNRRKVIFRVFTMCLMTAGNRAGSQNWRMERRWTSRSGSPQKIQMSMESLPHGRPVIPATVFGRMMPGNIRMPWRKWRLKL